MKKMKKLQMNEIDVVKVKNRAVILSKSIKHAKKLGVKISPNAPIEGKMFW